jgi:hypothetical protein
MGHLSADPVGMSLEGNARLAILLLGAGFVIFSLPRYSGGGQGGQGRGLGLRNMPHVPVESPLPNPPPGYRGREKEGAGDFEHY